MRPRICIVTPAVAKANNGNAHTAERWRRFLAPVADVDVALAWDGAPRSLMIALHARRSANSIARFRDRLPDAPLAVVLTGTDLYGDLDDAAIRHSLACASAIVVLQEAGPARLDASSRARARVIVQSASAVHSADRSLAAGFVAVGHLRDEKDPETAMRAACLFATGSATAEPVVLLAGPVPGAEPVVLLAGRVPTAEPVVPIAGRVPDAEPVVLLAGPVPGAEPFVHIGARSPSAEPFVHIGAALDPRLAAAAEATMAACPSYRWLGPRPHGVARRAIARARALVHPSRIEGGANVVVEAVRSGVPVLASRIDGNVGLLGADYAGTFDVGDAEALAALMRRMTFEPAFAARLAAQCAAREPLFRPAAERRAVRALVADLGVASGIPGR